MGDIGTVEVWVGYPRSYTAGRRRPVQLICWHYTAGAEGPTTAEAGAAYDKRRTDGTSCHVFVDSSGPGCREVPDGDRSHSALFHGNEIGIHIEVCGTRQTRAQWLDATSKATLDMLARLTATLCVRHNIPVKRLGTAEVRAAYYATEGKRPKGICDHAAITAAFPEDGGTHTDMGPAFPWDVVMPLVQHYYDELTEDDVSELFPAYGARDDEGTRNVQRQLLRLGYAVGDIDGDYDDELLKVVLKYRAERLEPDKVGSGKRITAWMVDSMAWEQNLLAAKTAALPSGTVLELGTAVVLGVDVPG